MENAHSELLDPLATMIRSILRGEVHTVSVGIVSAVKGMEPPPGHLPGAPFKVSPLLDVDLHYYRQFSGQEPEPMTPLIDVPVQFPGGGDWWQTFPIAIGDEVLILASERSLDEWKSNGGSAPVTNGRGFDLSDVFAIPCVRSGPRNELQAVSGGVVLGKADGSTLLTMDAENVRAIVGGTSLRVSGSKVYAEAVFPNVAPVDVFAVTIPAVGVTPAIGVSLLYHTHPVSESVAAASVPIPEVP
jgi:hypothetical protein